MSWQDVLDPFERLQIPFDDWVDTGLDWLVDNFRAVFQAIRWPIDQVLTFLETLLTWPPALIMIAVLALIGWQIAGRRMALGTAIAFFVMGIIGAYEQAMTTLAIVLTAVVFCVAIGLPTGIAMSRRDGLQGFMRPILDTMQTTPAFVYLVPIVMLFGIGNVPGVVVTIIFALPPLIRLTNLGIRQVPTDVIEAATAFGASRRQLLYKVQLPLATKTIMAGVNQTLMLALSMVVIASMISVGGLGQMVLRGIGRLDMGLATVGGVGIVLLAIVLDRMTQALGAEERESGRRTPTEVGPIGATLKLWRRLQPQSTAAAGPSSRPAA